MIDERTDELLDELAQAYRLFGALRWGETGDGHITARDPAQPECMWLLRHGVPFEHAQAADMVLVRPDGVAVDRAGERAVINQTAYFIHQPIHEARTDIVAAAHTHTPWGTPFAAERRRIAPISQESTVFFERHSLFDDPEVQVLSTDGGARIAAALGDGHSVVLCNHGLLTVGRSPGDAAGLFLTMERVAEVQMKARAAVPIPAAAARAARDNLSAISPSGSFGERAFWWAARRHLPWEFFGPSAGLGAAGFGGAGSRSADVDAVDASAAVYL